MLALGRRAGAAFLRQGCRSRCENYEPADPRSKSGQSVWLDQGRATTAEVRSRSTRGSFLKPLRQRSKALPRRCRASNNPGNSQVLKAFSLYRKYAAYQRRTPDATPALHQSGSVRACYDIDFIGFGDASRKTEHARRQ